MASRPNNPGAGGKVRKVSFRRSAHRTPYDRPPPPLIAAQPPDSAAPRNGLISKLVESASRIVARSASELFSSVFLRRLEAPLAVTGSPVAGSPVEGSPVTDYNQQGKDTPEAPLLLEKPSDKARDHLNDARNTINSHDGSQLGVTSHSHGISELRELLKKRTFTRAEFEQLSELLQSRVVVSSQSGPDNCLEQIRMLNVPEVTNIQSERVQLPNLDDVEGEISEQRKNESLELHRCLTPTDGNMIHEEFAASPAEIAKAYMGSRSSKAVPASRGIRNLTFQESRQLPNELSHGKKPFDFPLVSSPAIIGTPKVSDVRYPTPRIHGRSAMHRMSRSPFFKLQASAHNRGGRDIDAGPSTKYELTPMDIIQPENKKAVKRRISELDDGVTSSGHLRRIRQKYQFTTPLSKLSSSHALQVWDQHRKDDRTDSGSSQKPLYLEAQKYAGKVSTFAGEDIASPASIIPVPLQSSEMARKIFQQLDKLRPSPKERSSEHNVDDRNESPSKLTNNMLHGRALKSMQKIDLPNFLEAHEIGSSGAVCGAVQESLPGSITDTHDGGEESDCPEKHIKGLKVESESSGKGKSAIIVSDVKSSVNDPLFAASVGTANSAITFKPAFRMSAPEDFFDSEDENNLDDSSEVRRDDKLELMSELLPVNGEIAGSEKHIEPLSKPMPMPSTGSERDLDKKISDRPFAQNNNGFKLATTSVSISSAETCSLPPVSYVPFKSSDLPKEKVTGDTSLDTVTVLGNSATIKFDERSTWSSYPEDKVSEKSSYVNGEGLFTTFGGASSGLPTSSSPVLSISSDSTTFGLSRDIQPVASNTSVSVPTTKNSNKSVASVTNSTAAATCSISPSISMAAPIFSTDSLFQFDSSSSLVASKPLVLTADKPEAITQGTGSTASPSFGINDAVTPVTSMASFSSASNNSTLSSVFSSISSTSSIPASSLFSSISNSGSDLSTSVLSNSNNSLFAFGAPSTSAGLTSSFSSNSPQNLDALFQSNGSAIIIPESQLANGVSLHSQGSSCQFGSFASSPVFGLTGSSSSSVSSLSTFAGDPKPFGTSTGLSFLTASSTSSGSVGNTSFAPATTFGSSGFPSAGAFSSSTSGSGSFLVSETPFSSSSVFSFAAGAASSSTSSNSSSVAPSASTSIFTSSASTAPSSLFGSTTSSTTSSPTGFSFGAAPLSGSSPFTFGASSGSVYSFNSAGSTSSSISPAQPTFGVANQFASHASGSPANDQMNMEDRMADDLVQPSIPAVSPFGQPANAPTNPNFMFSSPAVPSSTSTFQFGNQQNFSVPQNPSLFQNSGNLEFSGGSFSLGSNADKAGRRIVRAKRDKHRKK